MTKTAEKEKGTTVNEEYSKEKKKTVEEIYSTKNINKIELINYGSLIVYLIRKALGK
ncbi:MAG: hypothetical protein RMJ36_03030 [Candidatus Calescibacterium sp.]|nr:hypothetical protein [Candidatus Calescibacterium sp.]MDW8132611.1 hypothetical protein [Candidatus Calescibacterium sp.]